MSRILKGKIPFNMFGVPTISDKYDILSGQVATTETEGLQEGAIVSIDELFSTGKVSKVTAQTKRVGVISHQNVLVELPGFTGFQVFKPNDVVGVFIKGFVAVVAHSNFDGADLKITGQELTKNGAIDLANKNLRTTGQIVENPSSGKKIVEIELI